MQCTRTSTRAPDTRRGRAPPLVHPIPSCGRAPSIHRASTPAWLAASQHPTPIPFPAETYSKHLRGILFLRYLPVVAGVELHEAQMHGGAAQNPAGGVAAAHAFGIEENNKLTAAGQWAIPALDTAQLSARPCTKRNTCQWLQGNNDL